MKTRRRDFVKLGCAFVLAPAGARGLRPAAGTDAHRAGRRSAASSARHPARGHGAQRHPLAVQLDARRRRRAPVVGRRAARRDPRRSRRGTLGEHRRRAPLDGRPAVRRPTMLDDIRGMNRVLAFDRERGLVEVEAGIQWPELLALPAATRRNGREPEQWGIVQKQTGADRLSLGGALASNVHGRGLTLKPLVDDVESFVLVGADGEVRQLQPRRERRAVPPRDRRLRPVRRRHVGHAAPRAAAQARARRRAARDRRTSWTRFAERIARRVSLRRLPVRDRRESRRFPATRRLLLLPARRPGDADHREPDASSAADDWARLTCSRTRTSAAAFDVYAAALPGDERAALLVRRAPARPPTSTTTTRDSIARLRREATRRPR